MLKFDKDTHLLEQDYYRYDLQDVSNPNLFRDIFPYTQLPMVPFNYRIVPMSPPKEIWITDTTFRDGQQARPPFTVKQIVKIYDLLHKLGGEKGIIRQCEFFLYSDKDKEAVKKCLERGYRYPEITGWIRAVTSDFMLVKDMGLKETGILTSASDYHIFLKLKKTRRQAMEEYLDIVRSALELGITPRCHFEDITRADIYGFVIPFAQELMKLSKQAKVPVKIRCCDTMGYGVTYPGASTPRSIPGIIYGLTHYANVPPECLEWHGHNDFHKVVINATTAWLYGCCAANGALLGLGERTGNTPVEALAVEYASLRGTTDGMDLTVVTEIAEYFSKEIGLHIPDNYPLVGKNFNITSAGIHIDGVLKNEEIYNIFDTAKILNRPLGVTLTDKSGTAGVVYWINEYLGLKDNKRIDKKHSAIEKIYKEIENRYIAEKRTTAISSIEMVELTKKYLPEYFK